MRAILFPAQDVIEVVELADPIAGPGEVLVQVRASGLCHTDVEVLNGNYGTGAYPLVPGHEYAGVVMDVGPEVNTVAIGDRVAIDPNLNCGTCVNCAKGWVHLCDALGAYGVTTNGGFAELSVVNADAVHSIGDLPFEHAALAEPIGCVLNGVDMAYEPHQRHALIFGAGPMGLLLGLVLQARGVGDVTLVEPADARRNLAAALGMSVLHPDEIHLRDMVQSVDYVADATGRANVVADALGYVAPGGTFHMFGVCPPSARVEMSPFDIFRRQLRVVGSHSLNRNIPESLNIVQQLQPKLDQLVSHRLSLEEMAHVFRNGLPANALKLQVTL
ncbi:alcohol dehydrogenase catalytic domain-containing protein [Marivita sp. XM-24bin2]|jgi:2-desacetyl-2-hydroxyethyl bacteriochlorophyllide A dehydrogenase|uniref:alcohol dehydrogenase catalytic domain-containing protein n=1 Tax=unclassified Marivita TaxID=2632480 RepID=UPI000D7A2EB5|nr:alcohol dehydrogenase catalytic domain-containing protein [Marivita sp. XM-24bin2]MCR9109093.1 alcohol dehydrogenase catalytic domain-containing protein [Paracoccaceae bacterium]PWL36904.1 MAG: zinc-binding dehydrogenase [Marivita sp. XM-24bin2]